MNPARLNALIRKECYQIIRDPSSILIALVLPILLIFIFTYAVSLDINHLRLGVVIEEQTAPARELAGAFINNPDFDITTATDRRQLEDALIAGSLRGLFIIPADFSARLQRGDAALQVITDGSEPNTATFVRNYCLGVWSNWLAQQQKLSGREQLPPVDADIRVWYNPELESRNFLLPGALALIMTLIGTLLTALVIAREWERGTMEALLSTAVSRSELLLGKLIPYFLLGMVSLILSVAAIILLFQVPFRGSLLLLLLTGAVFLFTALGLGLLISTTARNQFVACQIAFLSAFMPSLMLSGFLFEISSMPTAIQWLCQAIPAKYFISCLHALFLVGNIRAILLPNLLLMAAVGAILFGLTFVKTGKRLD